LINNAVVQFAEFNYWIIVVFVSIFLCILYILRWEYWIRCWILLYRTRSKLYIFSIIISLNYRI